MEPNLNELCRKNCLRVEVPILAFGLALPTAIMRKHLDYPDDPVPFPICFFFLKKKNYRVDRTKGVANVIFTQILPFAGSWRTTNFSLVVLPIIDLTVLDTWAILETKLYNALGLGPGSSSTT